MSNAQNLAYTVVQVAHNLGAVAAVSGSLAAVAVKNPPVRKKLVWVAFGGWGTQGASGAAFGAVSYYFYHRFPDISGIAVDALIIKIACVTAGLVVLAAYLAWSPLWTNARINGVCTASSALAITALCAAAFLRWFS
jgi:hypothetical protein